MKTFDVGDRVFNRLSKWYGTVLAEPGAHSGSPDLFAVLDDAGELHAVHPTLLEPLDGDGFAISRQMLIEKRQALFAEMVDTFAAMRQTDLSDPAARRQVEDLVRQMSRSWSSADAATWRRKWNPEHRRRFVRLVTAFLELGETLNLLGGKVS